MYLYVIALIVSRVHIFLKPMIYLATLCLSFYTRNHMFSFLAGLVISELSSAGVFAFVQARKMINRPAQAILYGWIISLAVLLPQTANALQSWFLGWSRVPVSGELFSFFQNRQVLQQGDFQLTLLAVSILVLVELSAGLQWIFSTRAFVFLGKYSFAFYCVHYVVMNSTTVTISQFLAPWFAGVDDGAIMHALLSFALTILYMSPFCLLFVHTADKYGIRGGRAMNQLTSKIHVKSIMSVLSLLITKLTPRRSSLPNLYLKLSPRDSVADKSDLETDAV